MAMVKTGDGSTRGCEGLNCPGIWTDQASGVVEIQGDDVTQAELPPGMPRGESRVRMSLDAFDRAARQHLGVA